MSRVVGEPRAGDVGNWSAQSAPRERTTSRGVAGRRDTASSVQRLVLQHHRQTLRLVMLTSSAMNRQTTYTTVLYGLTTSNQVTWPILHEDQLVGTFRWQVTAVASPGFGARRGTCKSYRVFTGGKGRHIVAVRLSTGQSALKKLNCCKSTGSTCPIAGDANGWPSRCNDWYGGHW